MISVDEVRTRSYEFPTIDFKFQNTGTATAFLWQFIISVTDAEVDTTPIMDFEASARDGALRVSVTNQGWGTASECSIEIDEPTLNQVFANQTRQYNGVVKSGQHQLVFDLSKNLAIPEQLKTLSKNFTILEEVLYYERETRNRKRTQGIKLQDAGIAWKCKDEKGKQQQGQGSLSVGGLGGGYFALTGDGFIEVQYPPSPMHAAMSDVTYITLIDPMKGAHERAYSISRKIPPGDIERFHVMVGSPVSCHLRLKFKFSIDKSTTIESNEFDVAIWNPRNRRFHCIYIDGSELSRTLDELQRQAKEGRLRYWEERELESIQRQSSNYPFISPKSRY